MTESGTLRLVSANFDKKMSIDGFDTLRELLTASMSLIEWCYSGFLDKKRCPFQLKIYGSVGEGLYYPWNILIDRDVDLMLVYRDIVAVENVIDMQQYNTATRIYLIENENTLPGYCYLREINEDTVNIPSAYLFANGAKYISSNRAKVISQTCMAPLTMHYNDNSMPDHVFHIIHDDQLLTQGPALKWYSSFSAHLDGDQCFFISRFDLVYVIRCPNWPSTASEWVSRARTYGWPTKEQIREIVDQGIYFAPVGCKSHLLEGMQWRYSFNEAERQLVRSFNTTQAKCYVLVKRIVSENVTRQFGEDIISSYHIKTLMFWTIEETDANAWIPNNLVHFIFLILNRLVFCVNILYCPNYFMPDENLFRNKVTAVIKGQLVAKLSCIIAEGWPVLTRLFNFALDQTFIDSVSHEDISVAYQVKQEILPSVDISQLVTKRFKPFMLSLYLAEIDKPELHDADSIHSTFGHLIDTLILEVYACNDTHRKEMLKDILASVCSTYGTHLMSLSSQVNVDSNGIYSMEARGEMYIEIASWRNQVDCLAKHANYAYMRGNFQSTFSTACNLLQRYFSLTVNLFDSYFSLYEIAQNFYRLYMTGIYPKTFSNRYVLSSEVVFWENELLAVPDDAKFEMFVTCEVVREKSLVPTFTECFVTDSYFYVSYLAFLAFRDLEHYDEADKLLQTMELICSVVPNSHMPVSLNLLGECYLKQGKVEKAVEKFVLSMKRNKRNTAPWHVARIVWRQLRLCSCKRR